MEGDLARNITIQIIVFTCVGVFVATAIACVLDMFNALKLAKDIRKKLHVVLLVQVIGVGVSAFSGFLNPKAVIRQAGTLENEKDELKAETINLSEEKRGLGLEIDLRRASATHTPESAPNEETVQKIITKVKSTSLNAVNILWVDDNPESVSYEKSALEKLGARVISARSTDEALALLQQSHFQLIISDFSREDDQSAAYTLLDQTKNLRSSPPLIIYSSSANPLYNAQAQAKGAYAETNEPFTLFELVISATEQSKTLP